MRNVQHLIESYFTEVEANLIDNYLIPAKQRDLSHADSINRSIKHKISKLEKVLDSLTGEPVPLETLRYVFSKNTEKIAFALQRETDRLVEIEGSFNPDGGQVTLGMRNDQNKLKDFYEALGELVPVNVNIKELTVDYAPSDGLNYRSADMLTEHGESRQERDPRMALFTENRSPMTERQFSQTSLDPNRGAYQRQQLSVSRSNERLEPGQSNGQSNTQSRKFGIIQMLT